MQLTQKVLDQFVYVSNVRLGDPARALARLFDAFCRRTGNAVAPRPWRTERAGLHSRADTRNPNAVALCGSFDGRPYVIDAPVTPGRCAFHDARIEEINHIGWYATGREVTL